MKQVKEKMISKLCWSIFISIISMAIIAISCADYSPYAPETFSSGNEKLILNQDENDTTLSDQDLPLERSDLEALDSKNNESTDIILNPIDSNTHVTGDTAVINPYEGGRIMIDSLKGENYLDIPPNAIDDTTEISVNVYDPAPVDAQASEPKKTYEFLFTPKGLVFSIPATLVLDQQLFASPSHEPATEIIWEYFDTVAGRWTDATIVGLSSDKSFHIQINHFSVYRATVSKYGGLSPSGQ